MAAPYGVDLRKKTLMLLKKGMSKKKISILLDIGEVISL
jgi:transposase